MWPTDLLLSNMMVPWLFQNINSVGNHHQIKTKVREKCWFNPKHNSKTLCNNAQTFLLVLPILSFILLPSILFKIVCTLIKKYFKTFSMATFANLSNFDFLGRYYIFPTFISKVAIIGITDKNWRKIQLFTNHYIFFV